MTWAAVTDPGLYAVRWLLNRFNWRAAYVRGRWELRDHRGTLLAHEPNAHAMVSRIRWLAITAEAKRRREARPTSP